MANISMRPVVIDDAVRDRAKKLMAFAYEHRENLEESRKRRSTGTLLKDAQAFTMAVPQGYHVAYTIEQDVNLGWVQRISVWNQSSPKFAPQPNAVAEILTQLFDIRAKRLGVPPGKEGVLNEALSVNQTELPNACIVVELLYPFAFPKTDSVGREQLHVEQ